MPTMATSSKQRIRATLRPTLPTSRQLSIAAEKEKKRAREEARLLLSGTENITGEAAYVPDHRKIKGPRLRPGLAFADVREYVQPITLSFCSKFPVKRELAEGILAAYVIVFPETLAQNYERFQDFRKIYSEIGFQKSQTFIYLHFTNIFEGPPSKHPLPPSKTRVWDNGSGWFNHRNAIIQGRGLPEDIQETGSQSLDRHVMNYSNRVKAETQIDLSHPAHSRMTAFAVEAYKTKPTHARLDVPPKQVEEEWKQQVIAVQQAALEQEKQGEVGSGPTYTTTDGQEADDVSMSEVGTSYISDAPKTPTKPRTDSLGTTLKGKGREKGKGKAAAVSARSWFAAVDRPEHTVADSEAETDFVEDDNDEDEDEDDDDEDGDYQG